MVKLNMANKQTAFEYALYMIAASYFDKAICKSKYTERKMLLHYKEQRYKQQYQMEDTCIDFMEELAEKLPEKILKQNMTVHFKRREKAPTEILFMNENYIVSFMGVYAGKKSKIIYKIWAKQPADSKSHQKEAAA